jgi:hypothetical protein
MGGESGMLRTVYVQSDAYGINHDNGFNDHDPQQHQH